MQKVTLFEEFRLIERCESEVNGAWKGAHLLLFFLAFVFGSFCTFCFHMLMYLFDEKCVLFPKVISINAIRHNPLYDFLPTDKDLKEDFPVDFLSTQWVDKTVCYLPTYVPLVSGIFGLVWTTMFLMCSTGSRTLTGLQRPWRVLPPVFIFSLAMGSLCFYTSVVTHYGLQELCLKLGEFTGSTTCAYTINVATLAYERRIRGVFQATRLTILSAWLHTSCWLLSALLALVRVLLAVDFQLVKINVELTGDLDKMLERHEKQVRTITPVVWFNKMEESESSLNLDPTLSIQHMDFMTRENEFAKLSELSLVPEELEKLARSPLYESVPLNRKFIVKILYDLIDRINLLERTDVKKRERRDSSPSETTDLSKTMLYEQEPDTTPRSQRNQPYPLRTQAITQTDDNRNVQLREMTPRPSPTKSGSPSPPRVNRIPPVTSKQIKESKITDEYKPSTSKLTAITSKKSNLKHTGVQTDRKAKSKKGGARKVQIAEFKGINTPDSNDDSSSGTMADEADKETQTKPKEKQE